MSKRETATVVVSIVALILSGVTATVSISQAERFSTSDYQATEAVKVDVARMLASLRSIMHKGALATQTSRSVSITPEQAVLQDFLTSTTAFAFYAWVGEKGYTAGEGREEEWRVFFFYLVELASAEHPYLAARRAADVERLFDDLSPGDIRKIASYNQNIVEGIADFAEYREGIPVIGALVRSTAEAAEERQPERLLARFKYIKSLGVSDPDLDLWIAVIEGDLEGLKQALEAGADQTVTDSQILSRYEEELSGFNERR